MKTIKPLPERVRGSVCSGVIMFDMTKVVEELIFNSLDAGAAKISIFLGISTCFVKVVDDGSGVCRDDLALLGERYATSRFHNFPDLETACESFGYRGEALASISDISLLEITTKAIGKPNGYRKVMKGSKCLSLGIHDERKDCGTTVIVRDLFYNQPVRRKYMQSSSKKVLDSIKQCVLRIALVYSNVSFSVLDTESDEELLLVNPSSPALSLLMRGSGSESLKSLRKVYDSHGMMNISGYISGPTDSSTLKAFQYIYINSRFVSKGPIHKLLNNLAASYECKDPWKHIDGLQTGKRNRPQSNPAYVLCITCPCHLYDLSFEPSMTYVEFKNWEPVLAFIEKIIISLWKNDTSLENVDGGAVLPTKGKRHEVADNKIDPKEDWLELIEPTRKKIKRNHHETPSRFQISPLHDIDRDGDLIFQESDLWSSRFEFERKSENLKEHKNTRGEFDLVKSWDIENEHSEDKVFEAAGFLETNLVSGMKSSTHLIERYPLDKSLVIDYTFSERSEETSFRFENFDNGSHVSNCNRKQLLRGCSSRGSSALNESISFHNERTESFRSIIPNEDLSEWLTPALRIKQDGFCCDASSDMFKSRGRVMHSLGTLTNGHDLFISGVFQRSKSTAIGENSNILPKEVGDFWPLMSFDSLSETMWDSDCQRSLGLQKAPDDSEKVFSEGNDIKFDDDIIPRLFCRESSVIRCTNDLIDAGNYSHLDQSFSESLWGHSKNAGIDHRGIRKNKFSQQSDTENNVCKRRSRRSHSAPPFYQEKKRFVSLNCSETKPKNSDPSCSYDFSSIKEHGAFQRHPRHRVLDEVADHNKKDTKSSGIAASDMEASAGCSKTLLLEPKKDDRDLISEANLDLVEPIMKWRHKSPMTKVANRSHDPRDRDSVLDISSGFLQRVTDESLIPDSMNRDALEDAKVLQQVDKKFIPVVASGMLAIIDQHAADERIRLEDLREKVLTGEARTVTYLEAEQDLILPEMGYQLLRSYEQQMGDWGWICNIDGHVSNSFKKDMNTIQRQPSRITLRAVPCILGVNLSHDDLLEFLHQLADTDGSSMIPPAVLRILNSKACRGAIMFGDSLLPSECSLIIEELKQTSLCFQCAHGRPTTVPLVNLKALHKQIAKLGLNQPWHGLQRQIVAFDRARIRLNAAKV